MSDRPPAPPPEEIVLYEKDPATKIATITMNRPGFLNAPTIAARQRFADLVHRARNRMAAMPTITNKPTHTSFLERCTGLS